MFSLFLIANARGGGVTLHDEDCWALAVGDDIQLFHSSSPPLVPTTMSEDVQGMCDGLTDSLKQKIAFKMTSCHHWRHHRLDSMIRKTDDICQGVRQWIEERPGDDTESRFMKHLQTVDYRSCLAHFSDTGFVIYTEFLNHFDNLCYYYLSKAWYEKVSTSVSDLLTSSQHVIEDLHNANALQLEIRAESEGIHTITKAIFSDTHQLAKAVKQGEDNIVHLIDRVSQDVITRSSNVTDSLEAILFKTREVQEWTSQTYYMVARLKHFGYLPIAAIAFWLLSRSQGFKTRCSLFGCLCMSIILTLFSSFNSHVMQYCQIGMMILSISIWLCSFFFGKSDLQKVLQEFRHLQGEIQWVLREHNQKLDAKVDHYESRDHGYKTAQVWTPPSSRNMQGMRRTSRSLQQEQISCNGM
eukprot:GHVH01007160.1.p1 GENE.GHVH01007160.1~~GHVH01007160.1.p1  ORF type:complete len:412 (-),score=45.28 GHVH01007160.1:135-1370(-)